MNKSSNRQKEGWIMTRWLLVVLQITLACVVVWEAWSVMGCPSSPYPCPQCNSQNRYPAGCGAFCIPVNPTQPYVCCCPGVWPTPYGPLPDCCVATCVKYDCAPIIPGISCPPYDLDFTPSHCFALNSRCDTTGPNPLQGQCK
jgi:hypothetical protein